MLRLNRPFISGITVISDRKPKLGSDFKPIKGEYYELKHVLTPDYSPRPLMENVPVWARDQHGDFETDSDGNKVQYVKNGKKVFELSHKKDGAGRKLFKPGRPFEVSDEDFVLEKHPAIVEKC